MASRSHARRQHPSVGSRVKIEFGGKEIAAIVLEDRGPVGIGGRRLLRIRLEIQDTSEPLEMEVPADEVKLAA